MQTLLHDIEIFHNHIKQAHEHSINEKCLSSKMTKEKCGNEKIETESQNEDHNSKVEEQDKRVITYSNEIQENSIEVSEVISEYFFVKFDNSSLLQTDSCIIKESDKENEPPFELVTPIEGKLKMVKHRKSRKFEHSDNINSNENLNIKNICTTLVDEQFLYESNSKEKIEKSVHLKNE